MFLATVQRYLMRDDVTGLSMFVKQQDMRKRFALTEGARVQRLTVLEMAMRVHPLPLVCLEFLLTLGSDWREVRGDSLLELAVSNKWLHVLEMILEDSPEPPTEAEALYALRYACWHPSTLRIKSALVHVLAERWPEPDKNLFNRFVRDDDDEFSEYVCERLLE